MLLNPLPGSKASVARDIRPLLLMPMARQEPLEPRTILVPTQRITSKMSTLVLLIVMMQWATRGCPLF
jgi:hypothetical protein